MTIYQITRKSDGVDVYRYAADAPIAWDGMGFDTHTHTPMAQDVPATPQGPRRLTKLAFIGKIGSEFAGILTAAKRMCRWSCSCGCSTGPHLTQMGQALILTTLALLTL